MSVWVLIFGLRKDLRKEMIFGSLLGLPFGLTEFLFIPEYWNPPTLFNLVEKIGFSIEGLCFSFIVAGIASVIYEAVDRKKTVAIRSSRKLNIIPFVLLIAVFIGLEFIFPDKTIYNAAIASIIAALVMAIRRRDLIMQIVVSAIVFTILYFLLFLVFNRLFPEFVSTIYVLENFWGIMVLGVPLEEIMFAFSLGACWSVFYEYIRGYRTRDLA